MKSFLRHPLLKGYQLDDPQMMNVCREIIARKPFLRKIYEEWYMDIAESLPNIDGNVVELGSGGGFLRSFIPGLITSEVVPNPNVDIVMDGRRMPFENESLRAIVMTDVFHHIPDVRAFMNEATRCVKKGGAIIMVEPWVTSWSKLIYGKLHHEPFNPDILSWEIQGDGPLSGANGALPWVVFQRDRDKFECEYSNWHIKEIKPMMPFSYIVSGGVSLRNLMPGFSYFLWRKLERALQRWTDRLAMFAKIELCKT